MMRWSLSAKSGGSLGTLVKCELIGAPGEVPRTRRMTLSSGHILSWFDFEGEAAAGAARFETIYSGICEGYFTTMTSPA